MKIFIFFYCKIKNMCKNIAKHLGKIMEQNKNYITLTQYLDNIGKIITRNFSTFEWVKCEISNINKVNGNYYIEVIDIDSSGQRTKNQTAIIYRNKESQTINKFKAETGQDLAKGMKVLFKLNATFSSKFSFSLVVQDIDPNFTLGEMEVKINKIRKKITENGFQYLNRNLASPIHFNKIAVISPAGAAGLADFSSEANFLSDNKVCDFDYYPATFEGDNAKNSILEAFKTINKVFDKNQEIPLIDEVGWSILSKLSSHKKIKDYTFIRNKRGELDLTQYKDCILKGEKTDYRLVRGNMIKEDGLVDKNDEFVSIDDFVNRKSKDFIENDLNKSRLICQQISNVDLRKRLKFTFSEPRDILANSCNYINSLRSFDDLKKLHFLLNSELLNWRFKVTSSNNHINNYELDELPILNLEQLDLNTFNGNKYENEMQICKLYGLNESEINYILDKVPNIKLEEIKLLDEVI